MANIFDLFDKIKKETPAATPEKDENSFLVEDE